MSDRASILGAIRSANRTPAQSVEAIAKEAAGLVIDPSAVQPDFDKADLVGRFISKATSERVTATVALVSGMAGIPRSVSDYLKQVRQDREFCVQSCATLDALDWSYLNRTPAMVEDGGIAVTLAEYGIAETGSVVFKSGADSPVLLNFLPLYHIVVLKAETMLAHTEDLWPLLGGSDAPQSRLLTIVTGTSGTADIEAKNVRGAHGPRHMHIILEGVQDKSSYPFWKRK